jgi:hypothetical protein
MKIMTLTARADAVSVVEAYAQLLHYEQRQSLLHEEGNERHSPNMASGGGGAWQPKGSRSPRRQDDPGKRSWQHRTTEAQWWQHQQQ